MRRRFYNNFLRDRAHDYLCIHIDSRSTGTAAVRHSLGSFWMVLDGVLAADQRQIWRLSVALATTHREIISAVSVSV